MKELVEVCELAAVAGAEVLQAWVGRFAARLKAPRDLVSEADEAAQQRIAEVIFEHFPDHVFVGEEQSAAERKRALPGQCCWIVDPLDGTANYVHGVPHYAVSVAVERDGKLLAGAILDPMLKEMFTAAAGKGAYLNGKRIQTSGITELENALLTASFPPRVTADLPVLREFLAFIQQSQAVRRGGSAALNLAYIAAGRYEGYWAADLHPWDAAAGVLLIEEAGGVVTNLLGEPFDVWAPKLLAVSTKELHAAMLRVIESCQATPR